MLNIRSVNVVFGEADDAGDAGNRPLKHIKSFENICCWVK
jgi:hypothetical protein